MKHAIATAIAAGTAPLLLIFTLPATALQVYVDQTAAYKYINATGAATQNVGNTPPPSPANWFAPNFDDTAWNTGNGPFSSGPTSGTIFDLGNASAPFAPDPLQPIPTTFTQWDILHDPLLRTRFALSAPTALTVWIAVDNGIGVLGTSVAGLYVNGVQTTHPVNAEGAAFRWEVAYNIPAQYTFAGTNLIALQLEDHGGATGFDMMVTAQSLDSTIPPFTTNPPPVIPEPNTWTMLIAGLTLVSWITLRRNV